MRRAFVGIGVMLGVVVGVGLAGEGCSSNHALACPSLPLACPSLDGVTMFCAWSDWACPAETACGEYLALVDVTVDAKLTYFYSAQSGAYVATTSEPLGGGGASCTNGPSSFTPPSSCDYETLFECAPVEQDGGGVPPYDASHDAEDTGAAPMPSSQPQAMPPAPTMAGP
jgi:hypothetical protein